MDLSVIIVNYNVREFLRGAIASVERAFEHGGMTGEILVVDNNSTDQSAEMVRVDCPNVRLFALEENLGFGRANNLGMREAKGDYFLLLNPDTVVAEDTLAIMLEFMRSHPEAGMAGCKLLNSDGSFQAACRRGFPTPWASFTKLFGLARLFPNWKLFAGYNLTYLPIDKTYEVDALCGAFMVMSRAAYDATRGFDEAYFMYGEDLDLCFRTQRAGLKVYYVHTTSTVHFQGESTRRSAMNEVSVFYDAMHIFVKKHYPASSLFLILLRLGIVARTMLAFAQKYRGAIALAALDFVTVAFSVLVGCVISIGSWFGLPAREYPWALIVPPAIVVVLLVALRAYGWTERRRARQIVLAMPATLISLSSLTYFFKEFPSSRELVVVITFVVTMLLLVNRASLRLADRFRLGGAASASPSLRRTLIVGTSEEARRIAVLLKRSEFLKRYEVLGFIGNSLERVNEELLPALPILGDLNMLPRLVRERKVQEVVFASDAASYAAMLGAMHRVSREATSARVNFNMVPTATDVMLSRRKIEILSADASLALMPFELNLQRVTHRIAKRLLDLTVSAFALPLTALCSLTSSERQAQRLVWKEVFRGNATLVGLASGEAQAAWLGKPGMTSLAAVAAPRDARAEDIHQFDQYYARNHTFGMDCEILLKAFLNRQARSPRLNT